MHLIWEPGETLVHDANVARQGTHREDSDFDIAVVTELEREAGLEAAKPLHEKEIVERHWTQIVCRAAGQIERYANTAGTLESRIARETVLIAGRWRRPACTEGAELEIDPEQALTWADVAAFNGMWAASWLGDAARESWPGDNEAGAKVQRMAEQVTKGVLATFGVYETDIHELDRSADELENAYAKSQWMKDERAARSGVRSAAPLARARREASSGSSGRREGRGEIRGETRARAHGH